MHPEAKSLSLSMEGKTESREFKVNPFSWKPAKLGMIVFKPGDTLHTNTVFYVSQPPLLLDWDYATVWPKNLSGCNMSLVS